jgi:hypothetical protein
MSLAVAAYADAAPRHNQIAALNFEERGARLRQALERAYKDLRHTGLFKAGGNDVSDIVEKYVPVGTSFADAETTLRSSGFDIERPREPPNIPCSLWNDENKSMMSLAIFGTLVLAQHGISRMTVEVTLLPKILEAGDQNTVKRVHAAICYRGV